MKFILTETKKFLLEERFVLNESTTLLETALSDVAAQWTKQLKATLDNTIEVVTKYSSFISLSPDSAAKQAKFKQIKSSIEAAGEELENSLSLPFSAIAEQGFKQIRGELGEYMRVLMMEVQDEPLLKDFDELDSIEKYIDRLAAIYKKDTDWTTADFEDLKKIFKWVSEKILPLLDVSDINANEAQINTFKSNCKKCIDLLTDLRKLLPEKFDAFDKEDLKEYRDLIQQASENPKLEKAESVTADFVAANLKQCQEQVQVLITNFTKLQKSTIITRQIANVQLATSNGQTDWKSKLAGAVNKDTIIQEFIYTMWSKSAAEVLKIKNTLLLECEAYGFSPEGDHKNPFISFISEVYLKYSGLVTPEKYNVIHNLVVDNSLTGKDLAGEGDMGRGNLVFCKALYSLDTKVIKLYVRKQYNLLKATTKDASFKTNAELAFNALYSLTEIATGEATKDSVNMSLRPMIDIEQLEAKWTGKVSDTAETDSNKNKIAINAELIRQINTTENAIKVLVALAIKFSSNDKVVALAQSCKEARELMSKTTTLEAIRKLVASIERLYKIEAITATQALSLAKSILESDQFTLTLE